MCMWPILFYFFTQCVSGIVGIFQSDSPLPSYAVSTLVSVSADSDHGAKLEQQTTKYNNILFTDRYFKSAALVVGVCMYVCLPACVCASFSMICWLQPYYSLLKTPSAHENCNSRSGNSEREWAWTQSFSWWYHMARKKLLVLHILYISHWSLKFRIFWETKYNLTWFS